MPGSPDTGAREPRRHGGTVATPVEALLSDDPELALVWADLNAWADAHPCACEAICVCDETTREDGMAVTDELTLVASWDLGDGIDPEQESFTFAAQTYDKTATAELTMTNAVWAALGRPVEVVVKKAS